MEEKRKEQEIGYHTINEVLVRLFHDIMDIEQKAIITEEFQDITNNDMHDEDRKRKKGEIICIEKGKKASNVIEKNGNKIYEETRNSILR